MNLLNILLNAFVLFVSLFIMFLGYCLVKGGFLLDGSLIFACGIALLFVEG